MNGLNTILLISAIVAFTAAALSFVLIRERDFVGPAVTEAGDEGEQPAEVALAAYAPSIELTPSMFAGSVAI